MKVLRQTLASYGIATSITSPSAFSSRAEGRFGCAFHAAAAILSITLSACAATAPVTPQVVTREVQIPVAVKCHPDIGPEPSYPDTDAALKAAPDLYTKVADLVAGRLLRIAREAQLNAALSGCAG